METKELTLEEIHEGTLEIVKKIIEICNELNINYGVMFGTLIGAIRHKGFIPWDDDFDIMMMRPDYERFQKYCLENESQLYPFRLMGRKNIDNYPFTINRFCDLRYRMETKLHSDIGMGIFIDIYPFDGIGNDIKKIKKEFKFKKFFYMKCATLASKEEFTVSKKGLVVSVGKYILYLYSKILGSEFFLNKFEELGLKHNLNESRYVSCITWDSSLRIFDKSLFSNYIYIDFENIKVKVPIGYDEILRILYDDYMKLPPKEKRIAHHEYKMYRK